jgi:hypothetical protein
MIIFRDDFPLASERATEEHLLNNVGYKEDC